eukprot:jgi/Botrbrau1/21088/Bobra.0144s0086.1
MPSSYANLWQDLHMLKHKGMRHKPYSADNNSFAGISPRQCYGMLALGSIHDINVRTRCCDNISQLQCQSRCGSGVKFSVVHAANHDVLCVTWIYSYIEAAKKMQRSCTGFLLRLILGTSSSVVIEMLFGCCGAVETG